jgi:hypothetical protein
MPAHGIRFGLLSATIAILALPASSAAAPYVPPGNSAATQYTEAVPTAGGPKATNKSKGGKTKAPSQVLGSRNTERLDAQGPQGHAAAEVAAATAPATVATAAAETQPATTANSEDSSRSGGQGGNSVGPHTGGAGAPAGDRAATKTGDTTHAQNPSGSSAFGQVVDQATGSGSSGQLGLLLPLLIVAVVVWSVAYLLRQQRKRPTG